jgi:hypothetical protein
MRVDVTNDDTVGRPGHVLSYPRASCRYAVAEIEVERYLSGQRITVNQYSVLPTLTGIGRKTLVHEKSYAISDDLLIKNRVAR